MKDFGGTEITVWAISQCPLIYGICLSFIFKSPFAGLVAYNKLSGDILWKTDAIEMKLMPSVCCKNCGRGSYSMVFSATDPVMHKNVVKQKGKVSAKPQTGEILWEYKNWEQYNSDVSGSDVGEGRLIVAGGYDLEWQ